MTSWRDASRIAARTPRHRRHRAPSRGECADSAVLRGSRAHLFEPHDGQLSSISTPYPEAARGDRCRPAGRFESARNRRRSCCAPGQPRTHPTRVDADESRLGRDGGAAHPRTRIPEDVSRVVHRLRLPLARPLRPVQSARRGSRRRVGITVAASCDRSTEQIADPRSFHRIRRREGEGSAFLNDTIHWAW